MKIWFVGGTKNLNLKGKKKFSGILEGKVLSKIKKKKKKC